MRFHFGISLKPKKIFKWLLFILGGLFAFFGVGNHKKALALTEYNPTNVYVTTTKQSYYKCEQNKSCQFITDIDDSFVQNGTSLPWSATLRGSIPYNKYFDAYAIRYLQIPVFNNVNGPTIPANSYVTATFEFNNLGSFIKGPNFNVVGLALRNTSDSWTYGNHGQQFSCNGDVCILTYNSGTTATRGFMLSFGLVSNTTNLDKFFLLNSYYHQNQVLTLKSVSVKYDNSGEDISNSINNQTSIINNMLGDIKEKLNDIFNNSQENTQQIIDSQEEIKDTITDDTPPTIDDSTFSDIEISSSNAVSGLLTMPITLLNKINNSLTDTCTPYTIPFGLTGGSETVTFPCIRVQDYLGESIWNYIDLFICLFMVYQIAMLIISSFESITSLEDGFSSLYSPRHAKPIGKHTSEVE